MAEFYIQPKGPRPDFRLVITFLWGDLHNVDTEGDSFNPASREWTELYCQNRENESETFEVSCVQNQPLVLRVESDRKYLAARVAYFLATETGTGIALQSTGPFESPQCVNETMGKDFDLNDARRRAEESPWRRSTLETPYPNLG